MGFADAVKTCFAKYFTFSGRASRPEYWWFVLFVFLGGIAASLLDALFFNSVTVRTDPDSVSVQDNGPLGALFALATFIPGLSAGWRRMHDSGRSGLFLLYPLIVLFGIGMYANVIDGFGQSTGGAFDLLGGVTGLAMVVALIVLVVSPLLVLWWLTRPSQPGPNVYGPNPHEVMT